MAALMIPPPAAIEVVDRQRPPFDLNDEETEVWAAVVGSHPADWFTPSTVPLLAQFCRHVIQARRIGQLLEKMFGDPEMSLKSYNALLRMQDRESRAMAGLATKMRITQQATTNHRGNKNAGGGGPKPWEFAG